MEVDREEVLDQLAAVRETGHCNMLDVNCVFDVADQCDFIELCDFIDQESRGDYMEALEEMGETRA